MHSARLLVLLAGFVLASALPGSAAASAASDQNSVVIEASGDVPGFTHTQLVAYLTRKTQDVIGASWHVTAASPDSAASPNRIVWSFKTLREVWKGGSHNGFPTPAYSETYISAEVKLYLGDAYQMTMITQPSVYGGTRDNDLSQMVRTVSHALFIENTP